MAVVKNEHGFLMIEVKPLLDWSGKGPEGCIASDKITKDGWKVGFMYRDTPSKGFPDSGWRFFKGDEDEEYSNNPDNHHIFALNTICNFDKAIIPYLDSPVGTFLIRTPDHRFIVDDQTKPIFMEKQS